MYTRDWPFGNLFAVNRGEISVGSSCRSSLAWLLARRSLAFFAMLTAALVYRCEHLTDWDSWDYAAQAIYAHSSDLLLGRWWFLAFMRGAYLVGKGLFGLSELEGYLAMQVACALCMAGAVAAGMAWTYRMTRSVAAELIFAALLVAGPVFGIYATAVMTEAPALLMLALAFWAWQRATAAERRRGVWAVAAGLAFGVMISMREQAATLAAWPIISCLTDKPSNRWRLLSLAVAACALTLAIGALGAWAWYPWTDRSYFQNIARWTAEMVKERRLYPVAPVANLISLGKFALVAAPLAAILLAPAAIWAALRATRLRWLMLATAPYLLTVLVNHDMSVNPRFLLPGMFALAPIVAVAVEAAVVRQRGRFALRLAGVSMLIIALTLAATAAGSGYIQKYHFSYARSMSAMYRNMLRLPDDAVILAGPGTPIAQYLNRLALKRFDVIRSGWQWPGEALDDVVAAAMKEGKRVYVNLTEADWKRVDRQSNEWEQLLSVAGDYKLDGSSWPLVRLRRRPREQTTRSTNLSKPH